MLEATATRFQSRTQKSVTSQVVDPLFCFQEYTTLNLSSLTDRVCALERQLAALSKSLFEQVTPQKTRHDALFKSGTTPAFEGLLSYLAKQYGNDQPIVSITASSVFRSNGFWDPQNILDGSSETIYGSADEENTWIRLDLGDKEVEVTHYTLRSGGQGIGGSHLKSWVLESSLDGEEWEEIDRRVDEVGLNYPGQEETFQVGRVAKGRFLRLRQTGLNWFGDHVMELSGFEMFGTIWI
jgi:hypothetical protein